MQGILTGALEQEENCPPPVFQEFHLFFLKLRPKNIKIQITFNVPISQS